jgi:hypothetical protein
MERTANLAGFAHDPTGQPRDRLGTLKAAMEASYFAIPSFRERELARLSQEAKDSQKKARKLAAVGGTSGSVPHRPTPETPEAREEWAVNQIAEAMGFGKQGA